MPNATISNRLTVDNTAYIYANTVAADSVIRTEKAGDTILAVAKIGQLTTRTSATVGELTMASGHAITTGQRLDIYWEEAGVKGCRRGVTVGTVASLAVPFTLGSGDNLPTNLTAVTAQVPAEEAFLVTGSNVQFIFAKATRRACIVFADASSAELHAIEAELDGTTGGGYQWFTGNGVTNPLAGDAVAKVFISNGSSAATNAVVVGVGHS